ncbi:MAG: SpoIIE family protein phosphatase, partial [Bacteroidota bacterium]
ADRTDEKLILKKELLRSLLIFSVTILLIVVLIYFRTRSITNPVKMLLQNVNRITDGHLSERAAVVGNNEITVLSEKFNIMIGELESYTNELEDKVRERTAEVVRQKEEIQKQHALITDSIHYAKRIQTAVLPGDETFSRLFRDYFIFFRPKDIVSGDFYFLLKVNKTIVFSAVDCTGHGVPGAFMSMLGTAFLNEIVRRQEVMHANQVLNILREKIKSSLKQKGGRHETKDGMDMALCAIDTETNELQYAGAYNPLLIIRNNEMIEFKGDRMPIGIHIKEKDTFTNHVVQLEKDDMIYIYSDGFSDQVGGEEKEKFRSDNFKRLLLEINQESLDKQRSRLELEFDNWKNNYKQIDDVMVLGVRI